MTDVFSIDPRTGEAVEVVAQETTADEVDRICADAAQAAAPLVELGRTGRAALLRSCADALEAARPQIVEVADRETALGTTRLEGELRRTSFQLRLFAQVLEEGSYLEASIDHAADTPMGPRPDLRRMLVPTGPVAVFGASNFPLAFSVPGGDTASALAAGCPVVVKAHGSHPATSQLCADVMSEALAAAGAPAGTLGVVHGVQAGADLVQHQAITAVGFTGSHAGAKALMGLIDRRPDPIPFYGELGSLNPVVVTPAAASERGPTIGEEAVASATLGAGQFCTKPGLFLVPGGAAGDAVVESMVAATEARSPQVLLNSGIASSFIRNGSALETTDGVRVLARGGGAQDLGDASRVVPLLLGTDASAMPDAVTEECFGPVTIVVRYADADELVAALDRMPASLTATVHRGSGEVELPRVLADRLLHRAGRIIFDAYPTGVAVSWAQHHGGPWPSTNTQHTSVGATAIRRFLRPVTWQDAPVELLPPELTDGPHPVPRRVDGVLRLPAIATAPA